MVSNGNCLTFDQNLYRPRLTQVWVWPKSEPRLPTLAPQLGQTCIRLGHHCRAPSPRQPMAFVAQSVGFSVFSRFTCERTSHFLKAPPVNEPLVFRPSPRERKSVSTEASPWTAKHISFLGGGWAPSRAWEAAEMECGLPILAGPGVLVGSL